MSTIPTTIIKRIIAVLKLPKNVSQAITEAEAIVAQVEANDPPFITPTPPLATISGHIDELRDAAVEAESRLEGKVQARNAAYRVLATDLNKLTAYVQGIADDNPADAETIIISAGLKVKTVTARVKPDFAVRNDSVSGTVRLISKAGPTRSSHDWQSSMNGTVWTSLPSTMQSKTKVSGLTPGNRVYFRHRTVTKDGPQNWSQVLNIIVL